MLDTAHRTPSVYEASYQETLIHHETEKKWTLRRAAVFMLVTSAILWSVIFFVMFQLAEVAISRSLFATILRLIDGLRPASLPP